MYNRLPLKDPRTVARDIPGILDALFPHLTAGMTAYFNKKTYSNINIQIISEADVLNTSLSRAMLFEVATARAEKMIFDKSSMDWENCINLAWKRQRRYYDAKLPDGFLEIDKLVASQAAENLVQILINLVDKQNKEYFINAPTIPGYQWIASGNGDFAIDKMLIEVKFINKNFGSADYRQVLMYWLLSYASMIEHDTKEWTSCALINPRLNKVLIFQFDELITACSAGRSKIELLELFSSMVGDYAFKSLKELRL